MKILICIVTLLFASQLSYGQWIKQTVDTTASFRGLSVASEKVVWASGTGGTVIKTMDAGKTWKVMTVPGAEKLDFRDIEAFDPNTAYILSIGNGESSRIYKTTDGGATWNLQFKNTNEKAFFDAIACWDKNNCIAMSDPVDNKFVLINTTDGGAKWTAMDTSKMPATKTGEAAFAASGTCLITQGKNNVFLVSGGMDARVFRSNDRGKNWLVADTPIVKGSSGSGIFSIAMWDSKNGVIVGGNYESPDLKDYTFATTTDGGVKWEVGARPFGYRSGVAYLDNQTIFSVGTNGSDVSYDRRLLWKRAGGVDFNSIAIKGINAIWTVGGKGGIWNFRPGSVVREKFDRDKASYPHIAAITSLQLSHSEIDLSCTPAKNQCSNRTKIDIRAFAPEVFSPYEYSYTVTGGTIIGDGSTAVWNLTDVKPGTYVITAGMRIPTDLSNMKTGWSVLGATHTKTVVVR